MEPVTHFLTGACLGRAGFNRKTAYATLVAVLAGEAADLDVIWGLAGPVNELKHHRGITHTFWAVPVVAGAAVGAVWLFDRLRQKRKAHAAPSGAPTLPTHSATQSPGPLVPAGVPSGRFVPAGVARSLPFPTPADTLPQKPRKTKHGPASHPRWADQSSTPPRTATHSAPAITARIPSHKPTFRSLSAVDERFGDLASVEDRELSEI
jgi:hypothetical protein